ncbi:MAG: bacillithiol biosynthesis deacetylase BshB1 [Ignavibacteriae bacterium]|nr:bacillithiol biosynthesis deacetylase BshB1 [Ignavibacteriota bacterium]
MKLDVLAIGAHPDDVELTCSGTIIKIVKQGRKVGLVDLTAGELGTRGSPEIRAEEAAEAAKLLGVSVRENLGLPDGNIEVNPTNRLRLIQLIRKYQPEVLLFPHWLERHPDHEHAHRLSRESWFYAGLEKIETRIDGKVQEPYRPRSYYHFMQSYEFVPTFIIDISDVYEQRMDVVRTFKSQFYDPHSEERETFLSNPEFMEMLRTRFEYFGDRIGKKYGEPFYSVNMVGVTDLFSLTI